MHVTAPTHPVLVHGHLPLSFPRPLRWAVRVVAGLDGVVGIVQGSRRGRHGRMWACMSGWLRIGRGTPRTLVGGVRPPAEQVNKIM